MAQTVPSTLNSATSVFPTVTTVPVAAGELLQARRCYVIRHADPLSVQRVPSSSARIGTARAIARLQYLADTQIDASTAMLT